MVAAAFGGYQIYEAYDDRPLTALNEEPLFSTNTEYKPKSNKKEEEEDPNPEWNNGPGLAETAIGIAATIKKWHSPGKGQVEDNGIVYTTHALERMAPKGLIHQGNKLYSRGIPPSVVENAIKFGKKGPGNSPHEITHTFEDIHVVTNVNSTRVVSVRRVTPK